MISDVHYIELWVEGKLVELESQDSLNLRINNVLFNPTKTTTTQAEYSYSFDIPSTQNNDKIFGYANNLAKTNKFRARYATEVYADGELIFDGSLTIQKYSSKDKMYSCNLVNIKINTLEEIFGDMVLTDLKWDIPFDGADTINDINNDGSTKFYFPLVSYGVFQKTPVSRDEVGATYTPKHTLDKYNKWWIESFYPSLNVVETMRKAFEAKGYNVGGSAFSNPIINWVFASCNLASEQCPTYNIGNPRFGHLSLDVSWNNYQSQDSYESSATNPLANSTGGLSQDLKFPYNRVTPAANASNATTTPQFNFSTIQFWNMLDSINNPSGVTVTMNEDSYMFDPNERLIVIPADGWYRIKLDVSAQLSGTNETFTANQWYTSYVNGDEYKRVSMTLTKGLKEHTPIEIQLIRNYDENIELIKGKKNIIYHTGDPNQATYQIGSRPHPNKYEWNTDFPHQNPYDSPLPTKSEDLGQFYRDKDNESNVVSSYQRNGDAVERSSTRNRTDNGAASSNSYGYIHKDGSVMPYDQAVSSAFICGFSTLGDGTVSVMRNGKSWSLSCAINNDVFANVDGLDLIEKKRNGNIIETVTIPTEYCKNEYKQARGYMYTSNSSMNGNIDCCVYLHRNDILELVAVQRDYEGQRYSTSAHCSIDITAMNNETQEVLRGNPDWTVNSQTAFPTQLNLFEFTNKETKISEWINNIVKAFNLELVMYKDGVDINVKKETNNNISYAIDIDDRVSSDEAESEFLTYPKEMSIQYKINTDEWGFEQSVPNDHINDEDWAEWGDSGFTIIKLDDETWQNETQNIQVNFSYNWYDNFLWKDVTSAGTETDYSGLTITIPTISKAEYMVEGYGYDEAMKYDGYSLTQRFWFRDQVSQEHIWLSSILADGSKEQVFLCYPTNYWKGVHLSYKDTEKSLATEYFNIKPMLSSNYVIVEVYLTPKEYEELKGGALVHFDSDLYIVSEISGYDPSGNNRTTLKLIKKV